MKLLRALKGHLFVPEILKIEYLEQARLAVSEQQDKITPALDRLQSLTGSTMRLPLWDDDFVDQKTLERLRLLESITQSLPIDDEIYVAAGKRSVQKRQPTSKTDHGYKDCLIWESLLRLPRGSEVRFVSHDKPAFFDRGAFSPALIAEAAERGIAVKGYGDLGSLVRELEASTPALDLTAGEAADVVEGEPADDGDSGTASSAILLPPTLPAGVPAGTVPLEDAVALANVQLAERLTNAQKPFERLDAKVMGYIAYLDGPTKLELFAVLAQSGIPIEIAKNVAERLAIANLVRDTGNHYLPVDRSIAEPAAAAVEPEIIELLTKTTPPDGQ